MSTRISPKREPAIGLDEPSHEHKGAIVNSNSRSKGASLFWRVFGFGSLLILLLAGMFSIGFVLGQEWGHKKSDLHWMSLNLKFEQKLEKINRRGVHPVQFQNQGYSDPLIHELKNGLAQMHGLGEELKLKLIDTHSLYAGMVGLPEQLRKLESLIKQWEAKKISLVEDVCPASEDLPRMLPDQVKTAKK